ncbi:MAG: hydrogenase 4 subunit F, partial [Chloroflexota bacterium]
MEQSALAWLVLSPLLLSLAAFGLLGLRRSALRACEGLHLVSITVVLLLGLLVIGGVLRGAPVSAWSGWLLADALAAVFLLIVAVVGFLVGLYSLGYIRQELAGGELDERQATLYYALFSLFLFTMLLAVTANNIIIMWVAIEGTTLGSAFLVGIHQHRAALEAAWKYVIICTVGVAFGLYGTVLVYSDAVNVLRQPGTAVLWSEIVRSAAVLDPTLLKLAFVFVLIGFGTKAGIFPMHAWLPDAHSEAPAPVSALLSGVLLNCALFIVIRFSVILNQAVGPAFTQNIFLVFGALSVLSAALFMYVQRDLKRLLAYSSVENIGLIVLALGIGGPAGTLAALLHTLNHSMVKSLMFCTSG